MKVVFSRFVEDDLDTIAASIAEDNPSRDLVRVERIVYGGRNLPSVLDQNDMN